MCGKIVLRIENQSVLYIKLNRVSQCVKLNLFFSIFVIYQARMIFKMYVRYSKYCQQISVINIQAKTTISVVKLDLSASFTTFGSWISYVLVLMLLMRGYSLK